jgi:hypothetical protein
MKITKRIQSNSCGSYSKAMGSRNLGGFLPAKRTPNSLDRGPGQAAVWFVFVSVFLVFGFRVGSIRFPDSTRRETILLRRRGLRRAGQFAATQMRH